MSRNIARFFHFSLEIEFNALGFINYTIPRLCSIYAVATITITIVSQPSKCLKFTTFREVCFVIHVEYKYSSEALETFYNHQLCKRRNKIISATWMIMMLNSENNDTRVGLVISLCPNSNQLIS